MKQFELNKKKYISIDAANVNLAFKELKEVIKHNMLEVLGEAKDLTDKHLKEMVERNEGVYRLSKQELFKDYTKEIYKHWTCKTRKESWQSFMRKNNINPNDLILKII